MSLNSGMPGLRIQYFRGPVWAKTNEQLKKQIVEGNNPITGKPVMAELVEKLTKPLTAEEKKTGEVKPTRVRLLLPALPMSFSSCSSKKDSPILCR